MNLIEMKIQSQIVRDRKSPLHSHQKDHDGPAQNVCHHSGKYLTSQESNPASKWLGLLREQHDFPGLPELDKSFRGASHSKEHEHIIWSKIGLAGAAWLLIMVIMIGFIIQLVNLTPYVPIDIRSEFYLFVIVAASGFALFSFGRGSYLLINRERLFHTDARAQNVAPAIPDFPLMCNFDLSIEETIQAKLGNHSVYPESVQANNQGKLIANIIPIANDFESLDKFRHHYESHGSGEFVTVGSIGLDGLMGIKFEDSQVEFEHRLLLRADSKQLTYSEEKGLLAPFDLTTEYLIERDALVIQQYGLGQFNLSCTPSVNNSNSRILELLFEWSPSEDVVVRSDLQLILKHCELKIDAKIRRFLGEPISVKSGRYAHEDELILWRNLPLRQTGAGTTWEIRLFVEFERHILNCPTILEGKYEVKLNQLSSKIQLEHDQIWNAWGKLIPEKDCFIRKRSTVTGELEISPQQLSQLHEYVTNEPTLIFKRSANSEFIKTVLNVVQEQGFELQKVFQAPPTVHPTGRLDTRTQYWDIVGRHYSITSLDSIDLHIVVTGYEPSSGLVRGDRVEPTAQIDVSLRCLHDPRNLITPETADVILGTVAKDEGSRKYYRAPEIPPYLLNTMRETLQSQDAFQSATRLQDLFAIDPLITWRHDLPDADTIAERVERTTNFLATCQTENGTNGVIAFLEVVTTLEQIESRKDDLLAMSQELQHYFSANLSVEGKISNLSSGILGELNDALGKCQKESL